MTRFSANLGFLWPELPLLERVEAAARAGFKAIELHWPYEIPGDVVHDLCDRLDLALLGINTVRGNIAIGENGLGALPGREDEFQAAVDQSILFCLKAGGRMIHCMAGNIGTEDRSRARDVFVANLRTACAKAGGHGLTLLLEPLNTVDAPGYFYSTLAEAASVQAEVDRPALKLMFDAYHVGMMGQNVLTTLRDYFLLVGHVQIAAIPSRAEPDEGSFDYRSFFDALVRHGYDGWIGAEYKPRGKTEEGLGWIRSLTEPASQAHHVWSKP